MRIFLTKVFARFASRERINTDALANAVRRANSGLIDADLGGGVIKQRIARRGSGKSGGYRTILVFRKGVRAIFVYGFAKNSRDNISAAELVVYRDLARLMLNFTDRELSDAIAGDELKEIVADG